jgi:bacterioferritin-associated ferredoxin
MSDTPYAVILVYSTSHAMRVEKLLQAQNIACKMIPVPRQISSDCGVCIRITRQDIDAARQAIHAGAVDIATIQEI